MNLLSKLILICCLFSQYTSFGSATLKDLYQEGGVFNIEGGNVTAHLNPCQKWCNMVVVLDRPFIKKVTYEDIFQSNPFPLKESYLLDYNEVHVNYAYLCTITYLLEKGRSFVDKKLEDPFNLCIHIHRTRSSPPFQALILNLLQTYYGYDFKPSKEDEKIFKLIPTHYYPFDPAFAKVIC